MQVGVVRSSGLGLSSQLCAKGTYAETSPSQADRPGALCVSRPWARFHRLDQISAMNSKVSYFLFVQILFKFELIF
jgi:hypothetical protein